ncbi:MAG: SDR family oxidoreductase [Balneolales bacterium]
MMNLNLSRQHFIVTGCSSGFGKAITEALCQEGARVTGVARQQDPLTRMHHNYPEHFTPVQGDLLKTDTLDRLEKSIAGKALHGLVLNAGGPPAKKAIETKVSDWDNAYQMVFRWKIDLTLRLLPQMIDAGYGRILYIESQSVKQPIPALALSNAMRAGITGFAKSLSLDVAPQGITVNVLAPGPHATPAIERVIEYRSKQTGETIEEAKKAMQRAIPIGRFGKAEEIASLTLWLLSEQSAFVTGQTISHAGGNIGGLFG